MLQLIKIKDPSLQWEFLSDFQLKTDCLVVSDIKTKLFAESRLLAGQGSLPGFCVARPMEFYKEIFCVLDGDWNEVEDNFVCQLLSEFCAQQKSPWVQNLQNSKSFFDFFNSFLVILLRKDSKGLFLEWLTEKSLPDFWKDWFELSQNFFNFLKSKKVIHRYGVKALLSDKLPTVEELPFNKDRIFVNLAFSIDELEKDIFKQLSRHKEVYILSPDLKKQAFFDQINIYQNIEEEAVEKTEETSHSQNKGQIFTVKSETQLEELKKALIQIKLWLKKGISLKDIALFAPNMEDYWPVLKIYLEKEKIPAKKSVFSSLLEFPDISRFLSALRVHSGKWSFEDLERVFFYRESGKDFSAFCSAYFDVPERKLSERLLFKRKILPANKLITGRQFVNWALAFWQKETADFLLERLLQIFQKWPMEESLQVLSWIKLLESDLSLVEEEISAENPNGLSCLSLNAFQSIKSSYVFIMGLNEESLKSSHISFLNETTSQQVLNDLGFPLALSYFKKKEDSLLWFLQSSYHKEVYLSNFVYDFMGNIKTTSAIHSLSEEAFHSLSQEISGSLLWDNNKKQKDIDKILKGSHFSKEKIQTLKSAFKNRDKAFFHKKAIELSPNSLNEYRECPFKYAARKLFFVQESAVVERELSPLSKGSTAHHLLESCLNQYPDLSLSQEQKEELIQSVLPKEEELVHEKQDSIVNKSLKDLLKLFLEKEKENQKQFPFLKPKAFETMAEVYWNQKTGELGSKGDYVFKCRVDRIDQDQKTGAYAVRDYKSRGDCFTHIPNWLKEDEEELQLTFYAQLLEKGLIKDLPVGKVSALFYSFYNQDFSAKGFVEKSSSLENLIGKKTRSPKQEKTVLEQAILNSNQKTKALVRLMEKGQFLPNPRTNQICKTCSYQAWCRVETLDNKPRKRENTHPTSNSKKKIKDQ